MKFSYNWLQKYFEEKLPKAEELAEKVGLHSFELEGVEKIKINNEKEDFLIDWDVLPNRSSDCLCYLGMAKEIAAVLDMKAKTFAFDGLWNATYSKNIKTSEYLSLEIEDKNLVKRATKRLAVNVKVEESPQWLRDFLESIGQRSINNVVDITNYVMWTTGQPVHAFDYNKIPGEENFKKVKITFAKDGEKITDLSEVKHELNSKVLVISANGKSLDIAGIKGGNDSGVDEKTTRIMLSAVNFEYENIRNTSRILKLQTDASKRFENEIPLRKTIIAMEQMSYLLKKYANAEISEEIIDTNPDYKNGREISCKISKINSLLGTEIKNSEIVKILNRLDLRGSQEIESDEFLVKVPEDRLDLNIWQDIAEEIGRIYGYENIKEKMPNEKFNLSKNNKIRKAVAKISDILVSFGFYEVYNRTIVKKGKIELKNSLNSNATALRTNLLEKLKDRAEKNLIHEDEPKLFEIGKIFTGFLPKEEAEKRNLIVDENFSFAGIIGKRKIKEKHKEDIFYQIKGYLESIFDNLNIKNISWKENDEEDFIAQIENKNGEIIGKVGINFWELNLEKLIESINNSIKYEKVSKYPKIKRDIAFFVPVNFTVEEARKIIKNELPKEAISLELFDIYKDKENNKKSFAFNIIFQSKEKTLEDIFIKDIMDNIYSILEKNNFEIR